MKIGERGQVTIPKPLRVKYGFLPFIEVEFIDHQNGILVRKKNKQSPIDDIYGLLGKNQTTDTIMEEIRGK